MVEHLPRGIRAIYQVRFNLVKSIGLSFTTLYVVISLEVTRKCSHALPFSCGTTNVCETPTTDVQLSWASNNRIPLLKTFCKQIEVAPVPVLSFSTVCRTAIT